MATKKAAPKTKKKTTKKKKTTAKKAVKKISLIKNIKEKKSKMEEAKRLVEQAEVLVSMSSKKVSQAYVYFQDYGSIRIGDPDTLNDIQGLCKGLAKSYSEQAAAIAEELKKETENEAIEETTA